MPKYIYSLLGFNFFFTGALLTPKNMDLRHKANAEAEYSSASNVCTGKVKQLKVDTTAKVIKRWM